MAGDQNTEGRRENEAEPLGEATALGGKDAVKRTGERSQQKAGPEGGDAKAVGDTFKKAPR